MLPCWKLTKVIFAESFYESKSNDTNLGDMDIVLPRLRSLKHEKSVKRKLSPGGHQAGYHPLISTTDYIWDTLHGNSKKNVEFWWAFAWKLPKCGVQKHASTLYVAMVTKGGRSWFKISFLFWHFASFNLSESFTLVAQGVLEKFEEVYLGGGGAQSTPWLGEG